MLMSYYIFRYQQHKRRVDFLASLFMDSLPNDPHAPPATKVQCGAVLDFNVCTVVPPATATAGRSNSPLKVTQQERYHPGSVRNKPLPAVVAESEQLEQLEQLAAALAQNHKLQTALDSALKSSSENRQDFEKAKQCWDQMLPLAVAGANVLAFKGQGGTASWCSFEVVGHGKCSPVRRGMMLDPAGSKKMIKVVFKPVDTLGAADLERGFVSLGSCMEPCMTAIGAAAIAQAKAALSMVGEEGVPAAAAAVAALSGALGGGDLLSLVNGLHLMLLPLLNTMSEKALLGYLDTIVPRPTSGFQSDEDELSWVQQRDSAAQQWMAQGNCRGQQTLVMVMPLAEGGSLNNHVAKSDRGFHCSANGALSLDNVLYVFWYLATQLLKIKQRGLMVRDIKTPNVLVSGGLPQLADFDLAVCGPLISWALKHGFATLGTKVSIWCGTRGYVAKDIVQDLKAALTAAELADAGGPGAEQLAGADVYGLCSTFLDILTGVLRKSLLSKPEFVRLMVESASGSSSSNSSSRPPPLVTQGASSNSSSRAVGDEIRSSSSSPALGNERVSSSSSPDAENENGSSSSSGSMPGLGDASSSESDVAAERANKSLLLEEWQYQVCTSVPQTVGVSQQVPERVRSALVRGVAMGASAAQRLQALEELLTAVGEEVEQRAARLGLSSLDFMRLQQQEVQGYEWARSS
jgi:serine/threonine protein kinase